MHVAAIMDGNRRWAKARGLPRDLGHRAGFNKLKKVLDWCPKYGIDTFTIYALSTENLQRSPDELKNIFDLIMRFKKERDRFIKQGIRVKILGNLDLLRPDVAQELTEIEKITAKQTKLIFQICVAYGGHDEIVRAIKRLVAAKEEIGVDNIEKYLDSAARPDVIIRTGGHQRLSNFLSWQSAYSELLFLDKYWPEFSAHDLKRAVDYVHHEQRNFGK